MVSNDVLGLSIRKLPMLKTTVVLCLGILLGNCVEISNLNVISVSIVVLFIFQVSLLWLKRLRFRYGLFNMFLYSLLFLLGVWLISQDKPNLSDKHFSHFNSSQLVGVVIREPVYKEKSVRAFIEVRGIRNATGVMPAEGKLMLTILSDSLKPILIRYGDLIAFSNKITETVKSLNPHEFDYKKYLSNQGVWHHCFLSNEDFKILKRSQANLITERSLMIRQKLMDKFALYIHDSEAYQIAVALIFGHRSHLDFSTLEAFRDTGTIHILSVSGLHVSLVFGLLTLTLFWMDSFSNGRIIRCFIVLLFIWSYVILTGMSPSVLRAGVMISFFVLSTISRKRQVALNTLFASAFCILLFSPSFLFDVGFQLSYSAMLGILLLYPLFKEIWLPNNKWFSIIVEYCYVSLAAQIFTLPLSLYYFGQFPFYFLIANLFIAIPSTLIMYLGIGLAISPISALNGLFGIGLDRVLNLVLKGLKIIANWPHSVFKDIPWDFSQAILFSLALFLLVVAFNYRRKVVFYGVIIIVFILSVYTTNKSFFYNYYTGIRVYNVRQDMAVAHIEKGKAILFTTLDSLEHASLKYSVLPDLQRYVNSNLVQFVKLDNVSKRNYEFKLSNHRILVVEDLISFVDSVSYDLVIWRKNNRNSFENVLTACRNSKIIIDGSNSQRTIDELRKSIDKNDDVYLLKNNFAYVWDSE